MASSPLLLCSAEPGHHALGVPATSVLSIPGRPDQGFCGKCSFDYARDIDDKLKERTDARFKVLVLEEKAAPCKCDEGDVWKGPCPVHPGCKYNALVKTHQARLEEYHRTQSARISASEHRAKRKDRGIDFYEKSVDALIKRAYSPAGNPADSRPDCAILLDLAQTIRALADAASGKLYDPSYY